jgi:ATP-dependent RNA helicase DHX8/PRP22
LRYFGKSEIKGVDQPSDELEVDVDYKEDAVEIELNDREAPFLTGQTTRAGVNLSPIKVVKNPDGTLQREALNAQQFGRERREMREQQQRALLESMPKEFSKYWDDPNAEPGTRTLAASLKGLGQQVIQRDKIFPHSKLLDI